MHRAQGIYRAEITASGRFAPWHFYLHLRGMPVICAGMNRDFAEWAGFQRLLADYPRDEDMSIQMMRSGSSSDGRR